MGASLAALRGVEGSIVSATGTSSGELEREVNRGFCINISTVGFTLSRKARL